MGCGALLPVFRAMLSSCLLPPARRAGLPVHDVATPCRWVVRVDSIIAGSSHRGASPDACIEKNIKRYDIRRYCNVFREPPRSVISVQPDRRDDGGPSRRLVIDENGAPRRVSAAAAPAAAGARTSRRRMGVRAQAWSAAHSAGARSSRGAAGTSSWLSAE